MSSSDFILAAALCNGGGGSVPAIDLRHLDFFANDGVAELSLEERQIVATTIGTIVESGNLAPVMVALSYGAELYLACNYMIGQGNNGTEFGLMGAVKAGTSDVSVIITASAISGTAQIMMTQ